MKLGEFWWSSGMLWFSSKCRFSYLTCTLFSNCTRSPMRKMVIYCIRFLDSAFTSPKNSPDHTAFPELLFFFSVSLFKTLFGTFRAKKIPIIIRRYSSGWFLRRLEHRGVDHHRHVTCIILAARLLYILLTDIFILVSCSNFPSVLGKIGTSIRYLENTK